MEYDEYQPGALWYFVFTGLLVPNIQNYDAFLTATMLLNVALLCAHVAFFLQKEYRRAAPIFLLIVLGAGPFLLLRFELFVSLLVLLGWDCLRKNRPAAGALLLGLATGTKLYPVILLPLFFLELMRQRRWMDVGRAAIFWTIGFLAPLAFFISLGGSLAGFMESMRVHGLKPVGLEGFWGVVLTLIQKAAGIPLRVGAGYGIHGLTPDLPLVTDTVLNYFWILPVALLYGTILLLYRRRGYTDWGLPFLLLFAFVYFNKVMNPHYVWWMASILPLVSISWYRTSHRWFAAILMAAAFALAQYDYPVYYDAFLAWYYGSSADSFYFWIIAIRDLLLLSILGSALVRMVRISRTTVAA